MFINKKENKSNNKNNNKDKDKSRDNSDDDNNYIYKSKILALLILYLRKNDY